MQEFKEEHYVAAVFAAVGGLGFLYLLVSSKVKRCLLITEAQWFIAVGILVHFVGLSYWRNLPERTFMILFNNLSRYVIAIQLISSALSLPRYWILYNWQALLWLICIVLPLSWMFAWAIALAFFPTIDSNVLLALAACTAPTDPVLSSSLVQGQLASETITPALKFIIVAESGINDGAGYPVVFGAVYIWQKGENYCTS
ncbi:hypothetical protein EON65_52550 [archaeon]|nr:MAG: hypothetical protein EON65_52550 [archaeon]